MRADQWKGAEGQDSGKRYTSKYTDVLRDTVLPFMVAVLLAPADVEGVATHPAVRPGPLGILEVPDAPPLAASEIDVLLMPCQAVDRRGNRLGKGGGFFDRFLALPGLRAARIVLAFHEQVLDEVPVGENDVPVEMVVSDAEVLTFGKDNSRLGANGPKSRARRQP